jgi:hypothetical protein
MTREGALRVIRRSPLPRLLFPCREEALRVIKRRL